MTKTDAHETLNFARIGGDVSVQAINDALLVTGDLRPYRGVHDLKQTASEEWPYYALTSGHREAA